MTKKNANNAIDFNRLLAVRNNLPSVAPVTVPTQEDPAPVVVEAAAQPHEGAQGGATVLEFTPREHSPVEALPAVQTDVDGLSRTDQKQAVEPVAVPAGTVVLRLGMSRTLHERVRASAALDGKTPAELARDLIECRTPLFPRTSSMASLAKEARDSFPSCESRTRVDVRMQVPVDAELHRRLRQLAALRAQTLVACVADLFEATIPSM